MARKHLTLDLPTTTARLLDRLARELEASRTETLRRAVSLLRVAWEGRRRGEALVLVDRKKVITARVETCLDGEE